MDLGRRIRVGGAILIAIAGAGSVLVASAVEAGSPELLPDLKTLKPLDYPNGLDLAVNESSATLYLSNRIGNHGVGPLELYAGPVDEDCTDEGQFPGPDLEADQRIFEDTNGNGRFNPKHDQVAEETKVGCFEYHDVPGHHHWHFQDFSQYKLEDAETGDDEAGPSEKIGFCIVDGDQAFPELPGSRKFGAYPTGTQGCGFNDPEGGPGTMGLSVGWADTYSLVTPGQELDVTGVTKGPYCLVSTANPDHSPDPDPSQLIESDGGNNARRTLIKLNPDKEKVKPLDGTCAAARKR